eukprot:scaffold635_cov51-Cyclotella_meneghiniana.AAC.1
MSPSLNPSSSPTNQPSSSPSVSPSAANNSTNPSLSPTNSPPRSPTSMPSVSPSLSPSRSPSASPTDVSDDPIALTKLAPSTSPSLNPSRSPSASPTVKWDNRIQFNATDGENGDYYGQSVGVSDYTIVVGAPYNGEIGQNSGAAYILQKNKNSGDWKEIQKITASDAAQNIRFGTNVALSGDITVVCSVGNHYYDIDGALYVFEFDENDDEWVEKDKLPANDGSGFYNIYSNSVAVSGKTIVAGSFTNNDVFGTKNAVHIFNKNENTGKWVQEQKLNATEGIDELFGYSVGVWGSIIVVGAPQSNALVGSAYIYEFNNSSGLWEQTGELSPKDDQGIGRFGLSVGVFENITVIGAPYSNNRVGFAYIFEKNITGSWVEVKRLEAPDIKHWNSYFGITTDLISIVAFFKIK